MVGKEENRKVKWVAEGDQKFKKSTRKTQEDFLTLITSEINNQTVQKHAKSLA